MPRQPTGNPTGRPLGSGALTPGMRAEEAQTRVTIRMPQELYDRLDAFAARQHFHRGAPQIAGVIREAVEEYLERHSNRQPENLPVPEERDNWLTESVSTPAAERTAPAWGTLRLPDVWPQDPVHPATPASGESTRQPETVPAVPLVDPGDDNRQPQTGPDVPPFDATKYTLGKLCPRHHQHGATGQSLLRLSNRHCLACDREKFHERKARRPTTRGA